MIFLVTQPPASQSQDVSQSDCAPASTTAPPPQSQRLAAILPELGHGPPEPQREGGRGGGDQTEGEAGRGGGVTLQVRGSPAAE